MNLPFLELTPKYLCQNAQGEPEYECGPAIFCTNK
jgi:OCT family organic cation transporter-like MFS transporter 4/5